MDRADGTIIAHLMHMTSMDKLYRAFPRLGRSLRAAALGACVAVALPGCMAHARGEIVYDHEAEYVEAPPPRIEHYPSTYYRGEPAYLVEGRWYYRSGPRWVVFRDEPRELREYRVHRAPVRYSDYGRARADQRRYEERRAAERRADQRRLDERRQAERRVEQRRLEQRRQDERRAEQRRLEERRRNDERRAEARRREDQRRAQERLEERRAEERRADEQRRLEQRGKTEHRRDRARPKRDRDEHREGNRRRERDDDN
jgi:hypothetical protein